MIYTIIHYVLIYISGNDKCDHEIGHKDMDFTKSIPLPACEVLSSNPIVIEVHLQLQLLVQNV